MPQGIVQGMWWILYLDDVPAVMTNAPTKERAIESFREMMLGHKLPESVRAVSIMDCEIEDLMRAYVAASMALQTTVAAALGAGPRRAGN